MPRSDDERGLNLDEDTKLDAHRAKAFLRGWLLKAANLKPDHGKTLEETQFERLQQRLMLNRQLRVWFGGLHADIRGSYQAVLTRFREELCTDKGEDYYAKQLRQKLDYAGAETAVGWLAGQAAAYTRVHYPTKTGDEPGSYQEMNWLGFARGAVKRTPPQMIQALLEHGKHSLTEFVDSFPNEIEEEEGDEFDADAVTFNNAVSRLGEKLKKKEDFFRESGQLSALRRKRAKKSHSSSSSSNESESESDSTASSETTSSSSEEEEKKKKKKKLSRKERAKLAKKEKRAKREAKRAEALAEEAEQAAAKAEAELELEGYGSGYDSAQRAANAEILNAIGGIRSEMATKAELEALRAAGKEDKFVMAANLRRVGDTVARLSGGPPRT